MSATIGTGERGMIWANPSAAAISLQVQRTMSAPSAASAWICSSVPSTSAVLVVVIDCTDIGASPPTFTDPSAIWRVFRRGLRGLAVTSIYPVCPFAHRSIRSTERVGDRGGDIEEERAGKQHEQHAHEGVDEGRHLVDVRVITLASPGAKPLVGGDGDVATVERQHRQHVEDPDEDVDDHQDQQQVTRT